MPDGTAGLPGSRVSDAADAALARIRRGLQWKGHDGHPTSLTLLSMGLVGLGMVLRARRV
jgi:hypothetical protein